jgi:hypothetical protein
MARLAVTAIATLARIEKAVATAQIGIARRVALIAKQQVAVIADLAGIETTVAADDRDAYSVNALT